jgi:hypothetical protein
MDSNTTDKQVGICTMDKTDIVYALTQYIVLKTFKKTKNIG